MGEGRVLGRAPDDCDEDQEEPSPPPNGAKTEDRTAQGVGTGQANSGSRGTSCSGRRLVSEIGVLPTAERFCRVPSMFDSLGVQVPYTTRWR